MVKQKRILALVLAIIMSFTTLLSSAAALTAGSGEVVIGFDDVRIEESATTATAVMQTAFDTNAWKALDGIDLFYNFNSSGVILASITGDKANLDINDELQFFAVGTSADELPELTFEFQNIQKTTEVALSAARTGEAPGGVSMIKVDGKRQYINGPIVHPFNIIKQHPLSVKVLGENETNFVNVNMTNYNYNSKNHNTYDSAAGAVDATTLEDDILWADSGTAQGQPTFNYTLAEGYKLVIKDNGTTLADITTPGAGTYKLKNEVAASGSEISFEFIRTTSKVEVTVLPEDGGKISFGPVQNAAEEVPSGDSVSVDAKQNGVFWIEAEAGYKLAEVLYDEEDITKDVSASGKLTLYFDDTAVLTDHTLVAKFEKLTFSVETTVVGSGDIQQKGDSTGAAVTGVIYGTDDLTVDFLAGEGYELTKLEVRNGATWTEITVADSYTFDPAITTADRGIRATFTLKNYDVKVLVDGGNGTVQYDNAAIADEKITVTHGAEPKVTFHPVDDTYQVKTIEVTNDGGATWLTVPNMEGATEYTFASIENGLRGIKVTFGTKVNSIVIGEDDEDIFGDTYDVNSNGMLILRGTWANEKTHMATAKVNNAAAPAGSVTWSVEGNADYDFADAPISVNETTGEITVIKSGIARVKATSTIDPSKSGYIVVIVPGDYDRDGFTNSADIGCIAKLAARKSGAEDARSYSFELADLDRDEAIRSGDISDVSKIASRKYKY